MPLKRHDERLVHGEHMNFYDEGRVSNGAKTHKFSVTSSYNQSLLGYVKYFAHWRQYTFFPLNCIMNKDCLREVADFCVELTTAHREKRKAFPAPLEVPVVEAVT